MKRRNLSRLLKAVPYPQAGQRGVSAQLAELQRYMRENALRALPTDGVSEEIGRTIGRAYRVVNYHAGSKSKCASYTKAWITGAPEYQAALDAAPAGLANVRGLLLTTPTAGVRDEWALCENGRKWKRVRRWRKCRGVDTLVTGDAKRIGRYSVQAAYADGGHCWRVETHSGKVSDKRTRTVIRGERVVADTPVKAIWQAIRPTVIGPQKRRSEATITARLLRRLCPSGWEVVVTPPSQGAAPSPAFRELDTGEEYHYPRTIAGRHPVREAALAFEKRAAQKDTAELSAIVDRGEAAGVFICAADSYRAGNCKQGTLTFAQRHGLDLGKHYTAGELAAQANGDLRFVRAAIIAGLRRERRELKAGVCELSAHRC